jgi:hypothetical protein
MDLVARSIAPLTTFLYAAIIGVVMSLLIVLAIANRVRGIFRAKSFRWNPGIRPPRGFGRQDRRHERHRR